MLELRPVTAAAQDVRVLVDQHARRRPPVTSAKCVVVTVSITASFGIAATLGVARIISAGGESIASSSPREEYFQVYPPAQGVRRKSVRYRRWTTRDGDHRAGRRPSAEPHES